MTKYLVLRVYIFASFITFSEFSLLEQSTNTLKFSTAFKFDKKMHSNLKY